MSIAGKYFRKGTDKTFIPSGYKVKEVTLRNHKGDEKDIQHLVVKLSLAENLFTPSVNLKLSVKDSNNLIENLELIGQETVHVRISYFLRDEDFERELDLFFFVTEYPTYGRVSSEHTQVYTINGVSEQMFLSGLRKISRGFNNNTALEIQKIMTVDLGLPADKFIYSGDSTTSMSGVINTQTPLRAIEWLRSSTVDANYAPFYFFQNINGFYTLISHSAFLEDETYQTYTYGKGFKQKPLTAADFSERATRIIECSSKLGMSKIKQARQGAWSSISRYLDISDKTYTPHQYDYNSDFKKDISTHPGNSALSDSFLVQSEKLTKNPDARTEFLSTNKNAFDGVLTNYNNELIKSRHYINAYQALSNSYVHDIKLYGDFGLNPGRIIELQFPKAIDPMVNKKYTNTSDFELFDQSISGKFLVTSVVHKFENSEYFVNVRCKKDTLSIEV